MPMTNICKMLRLPDAKATAIFHCYSRETGALSKAVSSNAFSRSSNADMPISRFS
jgi:hypothetical protein